MKPISPADVREVSDIPDEIIQLFNDLIKMKYRHGQARISMALVRENLVLRNIDMQHALAERWLDVESLYREQGWSVTYDQPGYNEDYGAYYLFEYPK